MGMMTDRREVLANATSPNVCAGKTAEFVQEPSVVRLFATGEAIGVFVTMVVGEEVVIDDQEVNAQNRMPISPDDYVCEAGAFPGDRITLRFRNSTAAALDAFSRVEVEPV